MGEVISSALREPLPNHARTTRYSESDEAHFNPREEFTHEVDDGKLTPLPRVQFSVVLYLELAKPIAGDIITPFTVKLVQETGVTGGDFTKVGYYVGFVESFYYFMQALVILQWGRISDRYGRRPVILIGLFSQGLSMLCFGLSHRFWAVVASRAIAGGLDGNKGVLNCVISEITDDTNIARGFSFIPIVWSVAATIAPLLGGLLQHPYERFGGVFEYGFWKTNPYFLPCFVSLSFSTSAFLLAYYMLKETAPSVVGMNRAQNINARLDLDGILAGNTPETTPLVPPQVSPSKASTIPPRALLTPRVILVILNYSILVLVDIAFTAIQPLFLNTPIEDGGLGMSPATIGTYLSAFGISKGIVSILLFTPLERRFGTRNVCTACIATYTACYAFYPIMNMLARAGGVGLGVSFLLIVQLALASFPPMAFSCVYVFLMAASPTRSAIGATNGMAESTTSIMRAIAPAGSSALFALSMERKLLGGVFVYVVFFCLSICAVAASATLPARPWKRAED